MGSRSRRRTVDALGLHVKVSNCGANGVTVLGADASKTPIPDVFFTDLTAFSSELNGMSINQGSRTTVIESAFKQNGADGIVVQSESNPGSVAIRDSRANYNVGWGIAGVRGVRSSGNTAVGNGQVRQCLVVECN